MTSSVIEDDLGAWGSPSAGHPRASAHLQSFVQKTLILAPIKQDLVSKLIFSLNLQGGFFDCSALKMTEYKEK